MEHDFSTVHGGTGDDDTSTNPCNGQGFMSYGSHPSQWTSCSVNDFTAQYELEKDHWCMPGNLYIELGAIYNLQLLRFILGQADFPVSRFGLYSPNN